MTASAAIDALPGPSEGPRAPPGAWELRRRNRASLLGRRRTPPVIARSVPRPRLTRVLSSASQLVVLAAPAGYGKTTILCEWDVHDERPFAWVTLEPDDNDPRCLEASVALAVERVEPDRPTGRLVLVLDDLQVLSSHAAQGVLAGLVDSLPPTITLAVASRTCPALPIARLRAQGRVTELGPADLAMDARETAALLRLAGLEPAPTTRGAVVAHRGLAGGRVARRAVPRRSPGARRGRGLRWRRPAGGGLRARRGARAGCGPRTGACSWRRPSSTRCPARRAITSWAARARRLRCPTSPASMAC